MVQEAFRLEPHGGGHVTVATSGVKVAGTDSQQPLDNTPTGIHDLHIALHGGVRPHHTAFA